MEKKKYAIAPTGVKIASYLTNGKRYEILKYCKKGKCESYDNFHIIADDGVRLEWCLPTDDSHLNGHSWTIIEE